MGPPPAIEVRGVSFTYPDGHRALHGLDLRVAAGERLAVLGPNGSGKTTLVLHLNGILRPDTGSVVVDGLPVDDDHLGEIRRRVGIVFQDPDDQLFMPTVRRDVAFGPANLGLTGAELEARVEQSLAAVGMTDAAARAPHHLSVGQRRRVALATVLAMDPTVVVFDEPSANLDPLARRELAELITTGGRTTLVVTHDLLYAAELCPRAVIVDEGRVVADGPTLELLADHALLAAHRLELPRYSSLGRGGRSADPGELLAEGQVDHPGPADAGAGHHQARVLGDDLTDHRRRGRDRVGAEHLEGTVGVGAGEHRHEAALVGDLERVQPEEPAGGTDHVGHRHIPLGDHDAQP